MKIELKNIKTAEHLSEETLAFSASLYIDGKPAYAAQNQGQGGCNSYHRLRDGVPSMAEIEAFLIASGEAEAGDFEILDAYLGKLIDEQQSAKRLARILKSKIALLDVDKSGKLAVFTYKAKPIPSEIARFQAAIAAGKLKGEIINGNPDAEKRALALI